MTKITVININIIASIIAVTMASSTVTSPGVTAGHGKKDINGDFSSDSSYQTIFLLIIWFYYIFKREKLMCDIAHYYSAL